MEENFEWNLYNYKISQIILKAGSLQKTIYPGQVQNFYIEKDFDMDYLPVFMITILMGTEDYQRITENQDTATLTIHIQGFINVDKKGTKENVHTYLNDTFRILPMDSTPFIDEKMYENMKNSPSYGDGTLVMSDLQQARTFILSKQSDLVSTKEIVNTVLSKSTMLTAASYVMSKCGCKNVLMSIPDNNTVYNELILLPVPLINQLRYLNSYYGFYKQGSQIFFDFDRTYFIRKNAGCSAFNNVETKNVVICVYETGSGNEYGKGSYTDSRNRIGYINTGADQLSVEDLSTTSSEYQGNNSLILNNSGDNSKATTSDGTNSFNIITTSSHNKYITQETSLRLEELKSVVHIVTSNCDLRLLTPNKHFQVISSSSKASTAVNKHYRLAQTRDVFIREGDHFCNITEITLKASDASK